MTTVDNPVSVHAPRRPHRVRRILLIVSGSFIAVIAFGLAAILIAGGIFVPANYLQPWAKSYPGQFSDPRMKLVASALLAPSGHNMQPWTIKLDAGDTSVLYLYTDPKRLTLAVDPLARQTLVSEGTFLAYLRVAGQHAGYSVAFDLFPNGTYDESQLTESMTSLPVAKITLTRSDGATKTPSANDYNSLYLSDTNRDPYTNTAVTSGQSSELTALADGSGASLTMFSDKHDIATLGAFGTEGTLIETKYAAATAESDRVFFANESAKNNARYGFAVEGQGTSGFMKYFLQGIITIDPAFNDDATGATRAIALTASEVTHTQDYAMILTPSNTRTDQVRAGILYADFCLRARTLGLVMQPLSQVLQEYPTMAAPYAAIHAQYAPNGQTIQMLVRVGTATTEYPVTMRRDAESLVVK